MLAYNHEKYIRQAIESILSQEVNFKLEILVADDASTDRTPEILKALQKENPSVIKVLNSSVNKGIVGNAALTTPEFRGEYIAFLDGDDYWENPSKLQQQIDFLDEHPEYNGVFHDAKIIHADLEANHKLFAEKYLYSQSYNYPATVFPSDLVKRLILPSSSIVFRLNFPYQTVFEISSDNYSFLWKLCIFSIKRSRFHYINEPWSVYRNHRKGISKSSNREFHNAHISFLKMLLKDEFYENYKVDILSSIVNEYTIILNSKDISKTHKKQIFRKYLIFEMRRIKEYRKKLMH